MHENSQHGLMSSVFVITLINVAGLGLAFLSSIIIAAKFGAGRDMDIYVAASTLPLYITSILATVLNFTFIPVFMEYRAKQNTESENIIVSSVLNVAIFATFFLAVLGVLFANPIMKLLAPGFSPDKLAISTDLLRWLMPIIILTAINELLSGVFFANKKFILPLLNKIFSPCIIVVFVLSFADSISTKSLVFASLATLILQLALLIAGCVKNKFFPYALIVRRSHPGVRKIFTLMTPLVLGMMFYRTIPMIDRFIASSLPEGAISHLGYSSKILSFIVSIVTFGISLASFPLMSNLAARKNWDELRRNLSRIIRFIFFLGIPASIFMGIYGRHVIQLFFERGTFFSADTIATSLALSIYLLALPASCIGIIIGQVYYALQDTVTPFIMGMIEIAFYVAVAFFLLPRYGFLTMPIAYVLYFHFALINGYIIRKKLGGTGGAKIMQSFFLHLAIAVFAAAILYYPIEWASTLILKNMLIGLGFLLYVFFSRYLVRSEEARILWERFFVRGLRNIADVTLRFYANQ